MQHATPGEPASAIPGVLTAEHLAILNQVLADSAKNDELLLKVRNAGAPLEHLEEQVRATVDIATGIKREFFPGAK